MSEPTYTAGGFLGRIRQCLHDIETRGFAWSTIRVNADEVPLIRAWLDSVAPVHREAVSPSEAIRLAEWLSTPPRTRRND